MKSRWNSVSQETSPAAETSDPPASAFFERRPLKQEGSLAHPVNRYNDGFTNLLVKLSAEE
jgi:hypothetical protein